MLGDFGGIFFVFQKGEEVAFDTCFGEFIFAWSGGDEDGLGNFFLKFLPGEGAIVKSRGESEAMFDEHSFSGEVALVHGADLGDGHVGFVDEEEPVFFWEEVEEGVWGLAWFGA